MSFEQIIQDVLKDVVPSIVKSAVQPLHQEIRELKSQWEAQKANPFGNKEKFSISELAEITGRSRSAIHKDINENKLAAFKQEGSKSKYIILEEALRYIRAKSTQKHLN